MSPARDICFYLVNSISRERMIAKFYRVNFGSFVKGFAVEVFIYSTFLLTGCLLWNFWDVTLIYGLACNWHFCFNFSTMIIELNSVLLSVVRESSMLLESLKQKLSLYGFEFTTSVVDPSDNFHSFVAPFFSRKVLGAVS